MALGAPELSSRWVSIPTNGHSNIAANEREKWGGKRHRGRKGEEEEQFGDERKNQNREKGKGEHRERKLKKQVRKEGGKGRKES